MSKLVFFLFAILAHAQSVEIYSEWQRPDPFGGIVQADRAWTPREILSPAVPRGGHATFHVTVSVPEKESYLLYVVTNPIEACRVSLFREHFVNTPAGWVPDGLTELTQLPDFGTMPDPDDKVPGQTTRAYLLDIWIPPDATPGRFRLEVQIKVAHWVVRPMEVRVVDARVEDRPAVAAAQPLPAIEAPADTSALSALAAFLRGEPLPAPPPLQTVRGFLARNALQDLSLAEDQTALQRLALDLLRLNATFRTRPLGAEWWLRVRDLVLAPR